MLGALIGAFFGYLVGSVIVEELDYHLPRGTRYNEYHPLFYAVVAITTLLGGVVGGVLGALL